VDLELIYLIFHLITLCEIHRFNIDFYHMTVVGQYGCVPLSVHLSYVGVLSKWLNMGL